MLMDHGQTVSEHGCFILAVASHLARGMLMDDGLSVGHVHRFSMYITNRLCLVLALKHMNFPSGIKKPVFSVNCNLLIASTVNL